VSYNRSGSSHRHDSPSILVLKLDALLSPILYGFASAFPRLAVLDIYLGIFTARWARYILLISGVCVIINAFVYVPTTITQCSPASSLWDVTVKGRCNDPSLHFGLASLPNLILDLILLVLPIPIVWNLSLEKATKVGVLATFLAGNAYVYLFIFHLHTPSSLPYHGEITHTIRGC
jgi:hypothetical protein